MEAVYHKKPIVVNTYSIYTMDIKPKGFSVIEIDGYVSEEAVQLTKKVLKDSALLKKMVDNNYEIASCYFSYDVLRKKLSNLLDSLK